MAKRPANSPLQGAEKERKESEGSGAGSSLPGSIRPVSYASVVTMGLATSATDSSSFMSATARMDNNGSGSQAPDLSIFKTSKPQGSFRDEIVVEIKTIDDVPYRGTITIQEAIKTIFIGAMGFHKESLGSLTIGYSMGRIVTYKLKDQFDIDQLASIEEFSFNRSSKRQSGETITQRLGCKIRGIHKVRVNDDLTYREDATRWVKIEGCEYRVEKEELTKWMGHLGEVLSEITEDRINLESDSEGEDQATGYTVGNGVYSVKMRLTRNLPQFVPICGKRIRLYYRGIIKMCTNCFGAHARRVCGSQKVQWIQYVSEFMQSHEDIPMEDYGKWAAIVKDSARKSEQQVSSGASPSVEENTQALEGDSLQGSSTMSEDMHGLNEVMVTTSNTASVDPAKTKGKTTQREPPREDLGTMLTRLRSLGVDVSPNVNKPNKENPSAQVPTQSGRGRRKTSLS